MRLTRTLILLSALFLPLAAYPQGRGKRVRSRTLEGTVVGTEEAPRWGAIVVASGGSQYVVPIAGGEFDSALVIGDVTDMGTPVRVTYTRVERWSRGRFALVPTRVESLQSAAPRGGARQGARGAQGEDWETFWRRFRSAIAKRDRAALRRMMRTPFESSGLENTPAKWIRFMDTTPGVWQATARAVASGTQPFDEYSREVGRPTRITNLRYLVFTLGADGRWRWSGLMGD